MILERTSKRDDAQTSSGVIRSVEAHSIQWGSVGMSVK